jgi:hypothetical protein
VAAGCWAVGQTDSGSDSGAGRSVTRRHRGRPGEDEDVFVDDEMGWLAAGSGPAGLGELPERWPGDQPAVADRGMQGDEVLEVDQAGAVGQLDGQGGQVIELTGSAGVLVTVTSSPPGRRSWPQPASTWLIPCCLAAPRARPRLAGWRE